MLIYNFTKKGIILEIVLALIISILFPDYLDIIINNIAKMVVNEQESYEINWNIFNILKNDSKLEEEKYPYIEEKLSPKKIKEFNGNIIVGIDFGYINSGYSHILGNDISNINVNKKSLSDIGLSIINQKGIHYSLTSSISMKNYNIDELNKIIYIKGIKSILNSLNNTINDNLCYIYPKRIINKLNIFNSIKEYFIMFKNDIIKEIRERYSQFDKIEEKIQWIISVPSSWGEFQKQLIMNALIISGMKNIKIIYELEAAALATYYNKYIPKNLKQKNKNFILIDTGGYSMDITAYQIVDNYGNIKEIDTIKTDNKFINNIKEQIIKVLYNFFGKKSIDKIKNDKPGEWVQILNDIDYAIESTYSIDGSEYFEINVRLNENLNKKVEYDYYGYKYKIVYDKISLKFPSSLIGKIILNNINNFKNIIQEIMNNLKQKKIKLDSIIITGGLSQNKIFQKEIEHYFNKDNKIKIEFLSSYQTAVSKGSVLYGIKPFQISTRISPTTIGIKDKSNKMEILIRKGDEIKKSVTIFKFLKSIGEQQKIIQFNIYISNDDKIGENNYFGRLLLKMNDKNIGIIQLRIQYDTCLNFHATNYNNGIEIETEFQFFK